MGQFPKDVKYANRAALLVLGALAFCVAVSACGGKQFEGAQRETGAAAGQTNVPQEIAGAGGAVSAAGCAALDCENASRCVIEAGDAHCECAPGFAGASCERNVDDCAAEPCQNGGACHDGLADYSCACPAGFGGKDCERVSSTCEPNPVSQRRRVRRERQRLRMRVR